MRIFQYFAQFWWCIMCEVMCCIVLQIFEEIFAEIIGYELVSTQNISIM